MEVFFYLNKKCYYKIKYYLIYKRIMTIHKMKLAITPFEKIVTGPKIIESRLYDKKRQQINIGDQIEFICNDDLAKKTVTIVNALLIYPDFKNLFSDFQASLFGGKSKEELLKEIEIFYSIEEQNKHGVIGIKIEVIK